MFLSPIMKNTSQKELFFPFKSYEIKSCTVLYLTEYQEETKHLSVFLFYKIIVCYQIRLFPFKMVIVFSIHNLNHKKSLCISRPQHI